MDCEYVRLTEQDEIWARMLMEVLEDNGIPCAALPVYGAGLAAKTGLQERLTVLVPAALLPQAAELLEAFFSADVAFEEA